MNKALFIFLPFLFIGLFANAQWKLATKLSLDYSNVDVGDSSADGRAAFNPDITLQYRFSERCAIGVGTGFYRVKTFDFGKMTAVPFFADFSFGNDLGIDFNFGYLLPVNSTSTPILGGLYSRIGLFIRTSFNDGDEVILGGHLYYYNISDISKIPTYIPDGYGPIISGISLGLYLQYVFPL